MRLVLEQTGKVLANDAAGRSQFVHSGGLAAVQQLAEAPGSKLKVRGAGVCRGLRVWCAALRWGASVFV